MAIERSGLIGITKKREKKGDKSRKFIGVSRAARDFEPDSFDDLESALKCS